MNRVKSSMSISFLTQEAAAVAAGELRDEEGRDGKEAGEVEDDEAEGDDADDLGKPEAGASHPAAAAAAADTAAAAAAVIVAAA